MKALMGARTWCHNLAARNRLTLLLSRAASRGQERPLGVGLLDALAFSDCGVPGLLFFSPKRPKEEVIQRTS